MVRSKKRRFSAAKGRGEVKWNNRHVSLGGGHLDKLDSCTGKLDTPITIRPAKQTEALKDILGPPNLTPPQFLTRKRSRSRATLAEVNPEGGNDRRSYERGIVCIIIMRG
jgi:hypothetical protein